MDLYNCEPYDYLINIEQQRSVIGGEVIFWSDFIDETNFVQNLWPRAACVAEILWARESMSSILLVEHRLNEHRCRMKRRGVKAAPINGVTRAAYCIT